jgi:hypothetical protein
LKSPVREFRTPGSVRGQLGNRLFDRDRQHSAGGVLSEKLSHFGFMKFVLRYGHYGFLKRFLTGGDLHSIQ